MWGHVAILFVLLVRFQCPANGSPARGFDLDRVESLVREVRAPGEEIEEDIAPAETKLGYIKSYRDGDGDDSGYYSNSEKKGKDGYKHFDSFHKQDGGKYGYQTHSSFGKKYEGEDKASALKDSYKDIKAGKATNVKKQRKSKRQDGEGGNYEVNEDIGEPHDHSDFTEGAGEGDLTANFFAGIDAEGGSGIEGDVNAAISEGEVNSGISEGEINAGFNEGGEGGGQGGFGEGGAGEAGFEGGEVSAGIQEGGGSADFQGGEGQNENLEAGPENFEIDNPELTAPLTNNAEYGEYESLVDDGGEYY